MSYNLTELRQILSKRFSEGELRDLCFELRASCSAFENLDYDDLPGEGRADKARELVLVAERRRSLAELEAAMHRLRPDLGTTYSRERVQELQASILATSQPDTRDAFVEFTQQIEAYLNEFNLLHEQLEEWKEVHNLLQDLQINFSPCRSYIFTMTRPGASGRPAQRQQERILYEIEVEWRPCKRTLSRLQELATSIETIGDPYDHQQGSGPDWFLEPQGFAEEINTALFDTDIVALGEHLSAFGDCVDRYLYQADKTLRDLVGKINRIPRPGSHVVGS